MAHWNTEKIVRRAGSKWLQLGVCHAVMSKRGVSVFEQPLSRLAWLDWAKSWCFASNNAKISRLATLCNYNKAHQSIAGVKKRSRGIHLEYYSRIPTLAGDDHHRISQLSGDETPR